MTNNNKEKQDDSDNRSIASCNNKNKKRPRSPTTTTTPLVIGNDSPPPPFPNWVWTVQGIGCFSSASSSGNAINNIGKDSSNSSSNIVAINLTDEEASLETKQLCSEVVNVHWLSSSQQESPPPCIPSIRHVLHICEVIDSFQSSSSSSSVLGLFCSNGKTRCGLVVAAYLKYSHFCPTTLDGFLFFCSKRFPSSKKDILLQIMPSSLRIFFHNFDLLVSSSSPLTETCSYFWSPYHPKKRQLQIITLKCITVQGIPVEDCPVLDVWTVDSNDNNGSTQKEYHPPTIKLIHSSTSNSYWTEDSGFFLVQEEFTNVEDFCLVFRFAEEGKPTATTDPTKIILRYTNHAGILLASNITSSTNTSSTIVLDVPLSNVDVTKRYRQAFSEEDFCISLLFEVTATDDRNQHNRQELIEDDVHTRDLQVICTKKRDTRSSSDEALITWLDTNLDFLNISTNTTPLEPSSQFPLLDDDLHNQLFYEMYLPMKGDVFDDLPSTDQQQQSSLLPFRLENEETTFPVHSSSIGHMMVMLTSQNNISPSSSTLDDLLQLKQEWAPSIIIMKEESSQLTEECDQFYDCSAECIALQQQNEHDHKSQNAAASSEISVSNTTEISSSTNDNCLPVTTAAEGFVVAAQQKNCISDGKLDDPQKALLAKIRNRRASASDKKANNKTNSSGNNAISSRTVEKSTKLSGNDDKTHVKNNSLDESSSPTKAGERFQQNSRNGSKAPDENFSSPISAKKDLSERGIQATTQPVTSSCPVVPTQSISLEQGITTDTNNKDVSPRKMLLTKIASRKAAAISPRDTVSKNQAAKKNTRGGDAIQMETSRANSTISIGEPAAAPAFADDESLLLCTPIAKSISDTGTFESSLPVPSLDEKTPAPKSPLSASVVVVANNNSESLLQSSMESPRRMLLAKMASRRGVSVTACDTNSDKEPFGCGSSGNAKEADSSGVKKVPETCYYCGKQGHIAASCPKKAIIVRKSPISSRIGKRETSNSFDSKTNTVSSSRNTIENNTAVTIGDPDNELHEPLPVGLETVEDAKFNPPRISIERKGALKSDGIKNSVQVTSCSDPVVTPLLPAAVSEKSKIDATKDDPRSVLLAKIKNRRATVAAATAAKKEVSASPDTNASNALDNAVPSNGDARHALLAAMSSYKSTGCEENKPPTAEPASSTGMDSRHSLIHLIHSRSPSTISSSSIADDATPPSRSAFLTAIKSRRTDNEAEKVLSPNGSLDVITEDLGASLPHSRSTLLPKEITKAPLLSLDTTGSEGIIDNKRFALLAAIRSRHKRSDVSAFAIPESRTNTIHNSNDFMKQQRVSPTEKVCNDKKSLEIPSLISGGDTPRALSSGSESHVLQNRNALLTAIRSRGRPDDLSSRASDEDRLKKRNDLLTAIKSRKVGEDSPEDSIGLNCTSTPRSADGEHRALLPPTSVCQKENTLDLTMGNGTDNSNDKKSLEIPSLISGGNTLRALSSGSESHVLQNRNALLTAIRSRGRPDDLSPRPSDEGRLKKRNDLLAAIKSRKVGEDSPKDSIDLSCTSTPRSADGEHRALLPPTSVCQEENTLDLSMGNETDNSEPSNVGAPQRLFDEKSLLATTKSKVDMKETVADSTISNFPSASTLEVGESLTMISAPESQERQNKEEISSNSADVESSSKSQRTTEDANEDSNDSKKIVLHTVQHDERTLMSYSPNKSVFPPPQKGLNGLEDKQSQQGIADHPKDSLRIPIRQPDKDDASVIEPSTPVFDEGKEAAPSQAFDEQNNRYCLLTAIKSRIGTEETSEEYSKANFLSPPHSLINSASPSAMNRHEKRNENPHPDGEVACSSEINDMLASMKPQTGSPAPGSQNAAVFHSANKKRANHGDGPSQGGDANRQNNGKALLSPTKSVRNADDASDDCPITSISLTRLPDAIEQPVSCQSINKMTTKSTKKWPTKHEDIPFKGEDRPNNRNALLEAITSRGSSKESCARNQKEMLSTLGSHRKPPNKSGGDRANDRTSLLAAIKARSAPQDICEESKGISLVLAPAVSSTPAPSQVFAVESFACSNFSTKNSTFAKPESLMAYTCKEEQGEQDISSIKRAVVELPEKLDNTESLETCTDNAQQDIPVAITKIESVVSPCTQFPGAISLREDHEKRILAVQNFLAPDGKSPVIMDLDPGKFSNSQIQGETTDDGLPLREDPEYEKYFKMLQIGLSVGAVQNALVRDGKDPGIMDLDPNKSLKSQQKGDKTDDGPVLREDPEYEKYFKMLTMGLPLGAVKHALVRDGKDPAIMDLDPDKSLKSQQKGHTTDDGPRRQDPDNEKCFKMLNMGLPLGGVRKDFVRDEVDTTIMDLDPDKSLKSQQKGDTTDDGPVLRKDPEYEKYFKMLKMGLPLGAVKNALVRDGRDPAIMDLDPDKSLKSQQKGDTIDDGLPLREDPEYEKYFKMLKMGLPVGAVQNALVRDGKDPGIMDLDPNKSLKSQQKGDTTDDGPVLRKDPEYEKYFKMLKMGLPLGAVKNALVRDGRDPAIMDLDPDKSLKSQQKGHTTDDGPPLREDPEYEKYFKMLKMGLPVGAVQNALVRDGKDPGIMDLDPNKSLKSQQKGDTTDDGPPLREDPEYEKYFKMLKMGLPLGAVKNALVRDGKDPAIMDLDPDKPLGSQLKADQTDDGPPLREDPEYEKYFKMLKMGLPVGAVQNALVRDGKDPGIMDLDPDKSLKSQQKGDATDDGPPLRKDPEYEKYFKMLKMGLPAGAVKNALVRDGKDPGIIDLDPNKSFAANMDRGVKAILSKSTTKQKKPKVRRKKIYWNSLDDSRIVEGSIWSLVQDDMPLEKLQYDIKEFESLFTEITSSDKSKPHREDSTPKHAKEQKKSTQVIEGKRGMNGGIVLARIKHDFADLAVMVDNMESRELDTTQLKAMQEFLPSEEESRGLRSYLSKCSSKKTKEEAMIELCACEKYMVAMMDVEDAHAKLESIIFRSQYETRRKEIVGEIEALIKACDELRRSDRLRKLMALILKVGNLINTGGEGDMARGFGLDALLKLNEAKAFDKKTSILFYLVKIAKQNNFSLLSFKEDLPSVSAAERIMIDGLSGELNQLRQELENVRETAEKDGNKKRESSMDHRRKISLTELSEQKSYTRKIAGVTHFNKMDCENDFTPMERFVQNTEISLNEAFTKESEMKRVYSGLLKYFGEDESMTSNDFFGIINKFIAEFDAAHGELKIIEAAKAKAEKAKLKEEKTASANKNNEISKETRNIKVLGSMASGSMPVSQDNVNTSTPVHHDNSEKEVIKDSMFPTKSLKITEKSTDNQAIQYLQNSGANNDASLPTKRNRKNNEDDPFKTDNTKHSNSRNGVLAAIRSRRVQDDACLKIDEENLSSSRKSELAIQGCDFETNRTIVSRDNALLSAIRSRGKEKDMVSQESKASQENDCDIVNALVDVEESAKDEIYDVCSSISPPTPMHELEEAVPTPEKPDIQERNALLSAIRSRKKVEDKPARNDRAKQSNSRNDLLSAIKSRRVEKSDIVNVLGDVEESTKDDICCFGSSVSPPTSMRELDEAVPTLEKADVQERNALLSAIRSRKKVEDKPARNDRAKQSNSRNDLLSAIKSRRVEKSDIVNVLVNVEESAKDEICDVGSSISPPTPMHEVDEAVPTLEKPDIQERNALLSAIRSRKKVEHKPARNDKAEQSNSRNDLLSAIKSRRVEKSDIVIEPGDVEESAKDEIYDVGSSILPPIPMHELEEAVPTPEKPDIQERNALLSAIRSRKKVEHKPARNDNAEQSNSRNDLLFAIKSRRVEDDACSKIDEENLSSSRKSELAIQGCDVETNSTVVSRDNALLPAIRSRGKEKDMVSQESKVSQEYDSDIVNALVDVAESAKDEIYDVCSSILPPTPMHELEEAVPTPEKPDIQERDALLTATTSRKKVEDKPVRNDRAKQSNSMNDLLSAIKSRRVEDDACSKIDEENLSSSRKSELAIQGCDVETNSTVVSRDNALLSAIRSRGKEKDMVSQESKVSQEYDSDIVNALVDVEESAKDEIYDVCSSISPPTPMHELEEAVPTLEKPDIQERNALLSAIRSRKKVEHKPARNDKAEQSNSRNDLLSAIKSRRVEDDACSKIDEENLSSSRKSELAMQGCDFETNRTIVSRDNALLSAIRSRGKEKDMVSQESKVSQENDSDIVNALVDVEESAKDEIYDVCSSISPPTPMHELDEAVPTLEKADTQERDALLTATTSRKKVEDKPVRNDRAKQSNSMNDLLSAIKSRRVQDDACLKIDEENLSSSRKSELAIQGCDFETNRTIVSRENALLSAIRSRGNEKDMVSQESKVSQTNESDIANALVDVEESAKDEIYDVCSSISPPTPMYELDEAVPTLEKADTQERDALLTATTSRKKVEDKPVRNDRAKQSNSMNDLLSAIKSRRVEDDVCLKTGAVTFPNSSTLSATSGDDITDFVVPLSQTHRQGNKDALLSAIRSRRKREDGPFQVVEILEPNNSDNSENSGSGSTSLHFRRHSAVKGREMPYDELVDSRNALLDAIRNRKLYKNDSSSKNSRRIVDTAFPTSHHPIKTVL